MDGIRIVALPSASIFPDFFNFSPDLTALNHRYPSLSVTHPHNISGRATTNHDLGTFFATKIFPLAKMLSPIGDLIRTRPAKEANATVDVIHIPLTGSPLAIVKLPLTSAASFGRSTIQGASSSKTEWYLQDVPNPERSPEWAIYATKYRQLVNLGNLDPDQPRSELLMKRGPFFMYKFPGAAKMEMHEGLNEHFRRVEDAEDVCGNAFIFKVKEPALEGGVVRYENLDADFIRSAFKGEGIAAEESLKWLANM